MDVRVELRLTHHRRNEIVLAESDRAELPVADVSRDEQKTPPLAADRGQHPRVLNWVRRSVDDSGLARLRPCTE